MQVNNHSMSRRLLHQFEAALTLAYGMLAISALATYAGVEDLDHEEIAAFINKKLPTASSYSKATEGGWADGRYKKLQPCMNFHRQHTQQDQHTTAVALLDPILV